MKHLVSSFQKHLGLRGVHVYSVDECRFLPWNEVILFVNRLPKHSDPEFSGKLLDSLANYDPDREFLAIHQLEDTVSIELYAKQIQNQNE
jgi:hypothetical protein